MWFPFSSSKQILFPFRKEIWIRSGFCLVNRSGFHLVKRSGFRLVNRSGFCFVNRSGFCFVNRSGLCRVNRSGFRLVNKQIWYLFSKQICFLLSKQIQFLFSLGPQSFWNEICTLRSQKQFSREKTLKPSKERIDLQKTLKIHCFCEDLQFGLFS